MIHEIVFSQKKHSEYAPFAVSGQLCQRFPSTRPEDRAKPSHGRETTFPGADMLARIDNRQRLMKSFSSGGRHVQTGTFNCDNFKNIHNCVVFYLTDKYKLQNLLLTKDNKK
ncbi:hypothetical protein [uncultured Roseibium sp.]|uniref:hypothetical protein n=1 Tax=uncultured Roseibium sp. TaxID=1936171 RepID=UPI0026162E38|nr:hypothetical protein [uncultured Roseibium sp.]